MASLNWSRGLESLGKNLGSMVQLQVGREEAEKERQHQSERDRFMMEREEHLMALRQNFETQMADKDFSQRKEIVSLEDTAARSRAEEERMYEGDVRRETQDFEKDMLNRRLKGEERLMSIKTDPTKNPDAYLAQATKIYNAETARIDSRMQEVQDKLIAEQGKWAELNDPSADPMSDPNFVKRVTPWLNETKKLEGAKRSLAKQYSFQTAQIGGGGYGFLTPEQVAEVEGRRPGGAAPATAPPTQRPAAAAATPVTAPPTRPPVSRAAQRTQQRQMVPTEEEPPATFPTSRGGAQAGPAGRMIAGAQRSIAAAQRPLVEVGESIRQAGSAASSGRDAAIKKRQFSRLDVADLRARLKTASAEDRELIEAELRRRQTK